MKTAACAVWLTAALTCCAVVRASQVGQAPDDNNREYEALLAQVKASDPSVDFLRLRQVWTHSDSYTAFADNAEGSMIDAAQAKQYDTALGIAREILTRNYLNLEAHLVAVLSCTELNDAECVAHHRYVARGLVESIYASGDGKTFETAFVVVSVDEEYALLRLSPYDVESQSLVKSGKSSYDVLSVKDRETGEQTKVYFNVDLELEALARVMGLK
jgi:hypothetical protein